MRKPLVLRILDWTLPLTAMLMLGMGFGALLGGEHVNSIAQVAAYPLIALLIVKFALQRRWRVRQERVLRGPAYTVTGAMPAIPEYTPTDTHR